MILLESSEEIVKKIKDYLDANKDGLPILKECCLENNWDYDDLMKIADRDSNVKSAAKMVLERREVNLEKGGITGEFNKPLVVHLLEKAEREKIEKSRFQRLEILDEILKTDIVDSEKFDADEDFSEYAQMNLGQF